MSTKILLAAMAYVVVTFAVAAPWHFVLFPDLYHELGMYNREEPSVALGVLSMLIQGLVLGYLYPRYYRGGPPVVEGVRFGLLAGAFLFSVSTLANAAKIQVSSIPGWIGIQLAFHLIQFVVAGAAIGLVFGRLAGRTEP